MLSILAGIMISIGGIINLSVGGIIGPFCFAIGLLAVLTCNLELFTGKAGLLPTQEITFLKLGKIWIGNFLGAISIALLYSAIPTQATAVVIEKASVIVQTRIATGPFMLIILGVFCGILMYVGVNGYKVTKNPILPIMAVAGFILGGFCHCVADMFYVCLGLKHFIDLWVILPVTIGNLIGCCLIPSGIHYFHHDIST